MERGQRGLMSLDAGGDPLVLVLEQLRCAFAADACGEGCARKRTAATVQRSFTHA